MKTYVVTVQVPISAEIRVVAGAEDGAIEYVKSHAFTFITDDDTVGFDMEDSSEYPEIACVGDIDIVDCYVDEEGR